MEETEQTVENINQGSRKKIKRKRKTQMLRMTKYVFFIILEFQTIPLNFHGCNFII